jgi:DNA-directed RNA polymerase specialized sigma24 family protein
MDTRTMIEDAGREASRWTRKDTPRWEDFRQDALLAMVAWADRVDGTRPEREQRAYLRRVARSAIVTTLRRGGRQPKTTTLDLGPEAPLHEVARLERALGRGTASPEENAEAKEVAEAIAAACEKMLEGCSPRNLAVMRGKTNVTERAVNFAKEAAERRLSLALRKLAVPILRRAERRTLVELAVGCAS